MSDSFWDYYQRFRQKYQHEHSKGPEAMSAFVYLRGLMEPHWTVEATKAHPIRNMLGVLGGALDSVLIGFAMRLRALESPDRWNELYRSGYLSVHGDALTLTAAGRRRSNNNDNALHDQRALPACWTPCAEAASMNEEDMA